MKTIVAVLCVFAFAIRTSGQTTTTYDTGIGHGSPKTTLPAVVITWDYQSETKSLLVHATNNSGKDIVAYCISVRHKLPDGTLDKQSFSGLIMDSLSMLVSAQVAKDPVTAERRLRESSAGPLAAGTTRDIRMENVSNSDVEVAADVVFYGDGSFDNQNENQFKRMLARRQGELLAINKANPIMRDSLADPANEHPTEAAIPELAKVAAEAMTHEADGQYDPARTELDSLRAAIFNMRLIARTVRERIGSPSQVGKTERERMTEYVEDQEKKAELMTPHCHLEIALK